MSEPQSQNRLVLWLVVIMLFCQLVIDIMLYLRLGDLLKFFGPIGP